MSVPRQRRRSLVTLGFLAAFAVAAFTAVWLLDYFVIDANQGGRVLGCEVLRAVIPPGGGGHAASPLRPAMGAGTNAVGVSRHGSQPPTSPQKQDRPGAVKKQ